jgi:very-short-patch-repair endonuclease
MFRQTLVRRSRDLRKHMTTAEVKLWSRLRADQLLALRVRRQHRIGSYIADFFCPAAKLVVELDGDSHDEREEYDAKRTYWMSQQGPRVARFANDDVLKHTDGVVRAIADICSDAARPSPQPSPRKQPRGEGVSQQPSTPGEMDHV